MFAPDHASALHDVEADPAESEDDDVRTRFDLRGVDHRADAGRHAATDVTNLVERRVASNLRDRDLRQHRVVRERRTSHVVMQLRPADRETARSVGHHAVALRRANRRAQIRLPTQARFAAATLRRVERNDVITLFRRRDAGTDVDDDARALVSEDDGKESLRIGAGARELVRVTHAGRFDLDEHFAGPRPLQLDLFDDERLPRLVCNGCACSHGSPLWSVMASLRRRGDGLRRRSRYHPP